MDTSVRAAHLTVKRVLCGRRVLDPARSGKGLLHGSLRERPDEPNKWAQKGIVRLHRECLPQPNGGSHRTPGCPRCNRRFQRRLEAYWVRARTDQANADGKRILDERLGVQGYLPENLGTGGHRDQHEWTPSGIGFSGILQSRRLGNRGSFWRRFRNSSASLRENSAACWGIGSTMPKEKRRDR